MLKRLLLLMLVAVITITVGVPSFTQEATGEDTTITEERVEDATTETAETTEDVTTEDTTATEPAVVATKAKTHFDGVNTFVNPKVQFKLKANDNFMADKIMYSIDGGEEMEYTGLFNISQEGEHKITYYGIDKIGNKETAKTFTVMVDNTAPVIRVVTKYPIMQKGEVVYVNKDNMFTVNASDTGSGVYSVTYMSKGTEMVDYTTSFNFFTDGEMEFKVAAEDNVANMVNKFSIALTDENGKAELVERESLKLFVDNTAPVVTIKADKDFISKNGKKVASKDYTYTIEATDQDSGVKKIEYRIDGKGSYMPYEGGFKILTNGEHFIEARAVDAVGNISNKMVLAVYVDVIPPMSTIELEIPEEEMKEETTEEESATEETEEVVEEEATEEEASTIE